MIIFDNILVTADRLPKSLRIKLTDAGRAALDNMTEADPDNEAEHAGALRFDRPYSVIWRALLSQGEGTQGEGTLYLLAEHEYEMLGALTSAPIIVTKPGRNDQGELTSFDAVFWFSNYQIESELETLLTKGEVLFDLASEPQDVMTCACGFETYDLEEMHAHKCQS